MDRKISFDPAPLVQPNPSSATVLVVGGGVTGLVTSWALLDRGYHVTIISEEWASYTKNQRLTSQIAGAVWEFPPAVCGQHTDVISLHHSKTWCMTAYRVWDAIAADPNLSLAFGVRMTKSAFFFPYRLEENEEQYNKMREIEQSGVRGFRHSAGLIKKYGINPKYGVKDAYELLVPVIDTDRAMLWLMNLIEGKGAEFVTGTVCRDLFDCEKELRERFDADVIVNATGLAGSELAGDASCYPIRGAMMRVINDGRDFPKVDAVLSISADAGEGDDEFVFIVPRNESILLLGGITQAHEWDLDLTTRSPVVQRMRRRCEKFLPGLENARVDDEYPLAQGLRPFRGSNIRVERELRRHKGYSKTLSSHQRGGISRIVHSYGHGGAGWTLSFGCAGDVTELVKEALNNGPPKAMAIR
jgi:D-amino-acid oxidase